MKNKVAQIIPYFGKWPEWIELYMYSCGRNPMVDFIFYTDCPLPKHKYDNTIFHQCSYEEYCKLVSSRLKIKFNPKSAYKLTDLKPFLGFVHEKELRDYDFWGFSDIDLVYGNLGMLVNDKFLSTYDLISTHSYRIAGHFTICRNTEYYRTLCFKINDWKKKLSSDTHFSLDEMDWSTLNNPYQRNIDRSFRYIFRYLGMKEYRAFDIFNKWLLPNKFLKECFTTPDPKPNNGCMQEWSYSLQDNEIINPQAHSIPYLHFFSFKKNIYEITDLYWRDGYYKLVDAVENYKCIRFNIKGIKGEL